MRKEVILSAGTVNSPKLLMLSGVGPRDNLEAMDVGVLYPVFKCRTEIFGFNAD